MDTYTIVDNEKFYTVWIVGNGAGSTTTSIDVSALELASGDETDRLQLQAAKWIIPGSTDSISLAWDDGSGGGAGSTFFTMAGNSSDMQRLPGAHLTADEVEAAYPSTAAGAGDLYITSTADDFTLILFFIKIEGFGGWPDAVGNEPPFGPAALD